MKILHKYNGSILKEIKGADLEGADLRHADLRYANLRYADLKGAALEGADLKGADLRHADLRHADLRCADLKGANLDYSCLPLWCGGQFKADERICKQLMAHVVRICELSKVDFKGLSDCKEFIKGWHKEDEF